MVDGAVGSFWFLSPASCFGLLVSIIISQLLDRYLDNKDFELLFGIEYISNSLMRVQAKKTEGCASGRCLLDELLAWPYLPYTVVATDPLSCEVLG